MNSVFSSVIERIAFDLANEKITSRKFNEITNKKSRGKNVETRHDTLRIPDRIFNSKILTSTLPRKREERELIVLRI